MCCDFLHQLKLLPFAHLTSRDTPKTPKTDSLEHDDLLALFDKFDYKHSDGVCHGFTLSWAQEAALGLESRFYDRLNLIKKEKERLPTKLHTISEKVKSSVVLSRKEQKINEIKPFLEGICLAQSPEEFYEVYAQSIQQSNIDVIYKMIQLGFSKDKNTVKNVFKKTIGVTSEKDLTQFLYTLNRMSNLTNQVAIVCSSDEHSVGFKKHEGGTWLFLDINHLYKQTEDQPYYLLDSSELSHMLYQALFETSEQLVFHCDFIAKPGQRKLLQDLRRLDTLYPINLKTSATVNCRGVGLLSFAVQNGQEEAANELLQVHKKHSVFSAEEIKSALFYAASCNRFQMMKKLISQLKIDINDSCSSNGDAPLSLACMSGHTRTVQVLLAVKTVDVDVRNSEEMTPLMLACQSAEASNHPVLFNSLLAAGADVELTNADGDTAYDIAKKHNNHTAMSILAAHSAKSKTEAEPTKSTKSKKKYSASKRGLFFHDSETETISSCEHGAAEEEEVDLVTPYM